MKRYLTLALSFVLFGFISAAFLLAMTEERDYVFLVPAILFGLFATALFICLVRELVIGHNEYEIENSYLHIRRKEKLFASFSKEDIEKLIVICDLVTEKKETLVITAKKKKFYVNLTEENREELLCFVEGVPHESKKNVWYYVASFFAH